MIDGRNIHLDGGRVGQTYPLGYQGCVLHCAYSLCNARHMGWVAAVGAFGGLGVEGGIKY